MLNVLGQSRSLAQLQRSLRASRLAHTWLFAGPLGVGKFKLAIELARLQLCDSPITRPNAGALPQLPPDFLLRLACTTCESCRAIDADSHPDVHIITKELIRYHDKTGKSKGTTLGIDVIRGEITGDPAQQKEAKIAKRSFRGRGKFFIIDEADLMEAPAQNALLKTLEEPPPDSYIILITASPQELLATIRSRSQIVTLSELPDEILLHALIGTGMDNDDAHLMARLARGSLGRALRWANDIRVIDEKNAAAAARKAKSDDADSDSPVDSKFTPGGILSWSRELGSTLDQLVAGRLSASDLAALLSKFAAEYAGLALLRDRLTSEDRAKRDGIALLLCMCADWFSDRLRHALGTPHPTPLPGISGALDYGLVPRLIATARAAEAQIDMNVNDKILLAATTIQWEHLLQESH